MWAAGASGIVVIDERTAQRNGKSATGVRVHLMSAGDRFDIATRTVTLKSDKTALSKNGSSVAAPADIFARWELLHVLDQFARSSQTELASPVKGGEITIRKDAAFRAVSAPGPGVQKAPAGLAMTGLSFDLRRN